MPDFSKPAHLPNRRGEAGPADPQELPRQRRGTTPQLHGRYPDYDVMDEVRHWDDVTRRLVEDRVDNVPPIRFFTPAEADTLKAFCDTVLAQDREPRIPVLSYVDEKLHNGELDGYQYFDMPDDRDVWRTVARGLDEAARAEGVHSFAAAPLVIRQHISHRFSRAELHGGAWATLNVSRAWSTVLRHASSAFYAHPWAWNEIGFGGPAYPRGYARFGSPHLEPHERETWEGKEAVADDPVHEVQARGLD